MEGIIVEFLSPIVYHSRKLTCVCIRVICITFSFKQKIMFWWLNQNDTPLYLMITFKYCFRNIAEIHRQWIYWGFKGLPSYLLRKKLFYGLGYSIFDIKRHTRVYGKQIKDENCTNLTITSVRHTINNYNIKQSRTEKMSVIRVSLVYKIWNLRIHSSWVCIIYIPWYQIAPYIVVLRIGCIIPFHNTDSVFGFGAWLRYIN